MATKSGLVSTALRTVSLASEKEIHSTLESIQKQCAQKRAELYELIKDDIVEFKQQADFTLSVRHELKEIENEFEKLSTKIQNDVRGKILSSSGKRQEIEGKLTETDKLIQFLTCLYSIYEMFTSSWKDFETEKYGMAASKIRKALTAINEVSSDGKNAQIFVSLQNELSQKRDKLRKALDQKWHSIFHWEPRKFTASTDPLNNTLLVTKDQMDDIFEAMEELGIWENMVRSFTRKLMAAFCTPFVSSQDRLIVIDDRNKAVLLSFKSIKSPRGIPDTFSCLLKVFQLMHNVVPDEYRQSWLSSIQMEVKETLPNLLIEKCLTDSVPSSVEGLRHYNQVITLTEEFEKSLVNLSVLPADFNQLSKYVRNVNVHFSKKQVEDILVQTRNILVRPLHSTKLVKQKDVLENLDTLGTVAPVQIDSLEDIFSEEELDSKLFHFPTCHVSENVLEFVQLLYNSLIKCVQSTGAAAVQLFHTCRDMLDLYCAVVPSCHKKVIAEIPRVAAVHHTNCLYIAHHLLTLGHQFQARLPPPLNSATSTFIDFIPKLQQLGEEAFLCELRKQKDITLQPLKAVGSFENVSFKERQLNVQRSLEQSLLHISQVSSVFHEVLPIHIHVKSTGALIDSLIVCFIDKVTCLEDISEEDSTILYSFIQSILQKVMSIFQAKKSTQSTDPSSVCSHFAKLKDLGFVLSTSLVTIVDGWQSGHLANHFTPLELRSLIKAIFQNTDHRAKSLAKISA